MAYTPTCLSPSEIEHFIEYGFVHLPNALPPEFAKHCADEMLAYMGIDEHDPSTWPARIAKPGNRGDIPAGEEERRYRYDAHAPRLWAAMCDLMGGPDRIIPDKTFRSNGVYKLADPEVLAAPDPLALWQAPLPNEGRGNWHIDGSSEWFTHYLDSRQVGLLTLILFRDMTMHGGATWIAPESPRLVSQYYAANPVGRVPSRAEILTKCTDFRPAEGKAGDAFLLHPFMMHSAAPNVLPQPRLMENDNVSFAESMRFDYEDPADACAVERSILRHLGVDSLHFVRQPKAT